MTAYDGPALPGSAPPPSLLTFCRGGPVPPITSSGPDLLLVLRTSPHSSPTLPPYQGGAAGYQLDVKVVLVDLETELVVPRDPGTGGPECKFSFTSTMEREGNISSLLHHLPANQTCSWQFQALPGEVVW